MFIIDSGINIKSFHITTTHQRPFDIGAILFAILRGCFWWWHCAFELSRPALWVQTWLFGRKIVASSLLIDWLVFSRYNRLLNKGLATVHQSGLATVQQSVQFLVPRTGSETDSIMWTATTTVDSCSFLVSQNPPGAASFYIFFCLSHSKGRAGFEKSRWPNGSVWSTVPAAFVCAMGAASPDCQPLLLRTHGTCVGPSCSVTASCLCHPLIMTDWLPFIIHNGCQTCC